MPTPLDKVAAAADTNWKTLKKKWFSTILLKIDLVLFTDGSS